MSAPLGLRMWVCLPSSLSFVVGSSGSEMSQICPSPAHAPTAVSVGMIAVTSWQPMNPRPGAGVVSELSGCSLTVTSFSLCTL